MGEFTKKQRKKQKNGRRSSRFRRLFVSIGVMERKLKNLFDYQKFENDEELNEVIRSALKGGVELSDEDLDMVSAAGEPVIEDKKNKNDKQGEKR